MRQTIFAVAGMQLALGLIVIWNGVFSKSDPATRGLDQVTAIAAAVILALFILPSLGLAHKKRWLRLALALALTPVTLAMAVALWATFAK